MHHPHKQTPLCWNCLSSKCAEMSSKAGKEYLHFYSSKIKMRYGSDKVFRKNSYIWKFVLKWAPSLRAICGPSIVVLHGAGFTTGAQLILVESSPYIKKGNRPHHQILVSTLTPVLTGKHFLSSCNSHS